MKLLALFASVAVLGSNKEIDIIGQLKIGWVQLHPSDGLFEGVMHYYQLFATLVGQLIKIEVSLLVGWSMQR